MNSLLPLVRGYLQTAGFNVVAEHKECLVADKLSFGQDRDTRIIWTVPLDQEPSSYEPSLRGSISSLRPSYPEAKGYVVANTRSGFSQALLETLKEQGIGIRVPVQFFDTEFKHDVAPQFTSAIAPLRSLDILQKRVAQPYRAYEAEDGEGADLFDTLLADLKDAPGPVVRLVVGRAGIGKTFLFRALFARRNGDFYEAKARLAPRPRPIPFLPEHLNDIYALRTELLVENFLRTEVASPVPRQAFEWLLVNGFSTWLLDGLDELYAGDPYFFDYLEDLLTRPGSRAQIAIWCRDSVLTTSDAFVDFQNQCAGSGFLKLYHLKEWERGSKRHFAWQRLEGKLPDSGGSDTPRVTSFLTTLDRSTTLRSLSGLPFYCELLLQQFEAGTLQEFSDDVTMLNHAIDQMIQRDIGKGLLDLQLFEPQGLESWLELVACDYVEGGSIKRSDAEGYGSMVLGKGVDEQTQKHVLISLLRFPLFSAGAESGLISFTHELIAGALAARAYVRSLRQYPADVGKRLSRVDLDEPALLRFMASRIGEPEATAVVQALKGQDVLAREFAVLLSLLMLARPERDILRRSQLLLEGRDLSSVHFEKRDLSGLSFRRADLSHAVFADCDLRGATFEGAFLNRTRFEGDNQLEGAHFGDLSRVQSIMVRRQLLEDPHQLRKWFSERTGRPQESGEPCPGAMQMLYLFSKFITPLGEPRRDDLKRTGLLAGKRHSSRVSPEDCIKESVAFGYLTGPDYRERFRRATGDRYQQLVEFVRDRKVSDGLKDPISRLCTIHGCPHRLAAD